MSKQLGDPKTWGPRQVLHLPHLISTTDEEGRFKVKTFLFLRDTLFFAQKWKKRTMFWAMYPILRLFFYYVRISK